MIAPCGLTCGSCPIHLRINVEEVAKTKGRRPDEIRCDGCRSAEPYHCCAVRRCCLEEKKLDFCFECGEFICEKLRRWSAPLHRKKGIANLTEMKEVGAEAWLARKEREEGV